MNWLSKSILVPGVTVLAMTICLSSIALAEDQTPATEEDAVLKTVLNNDKVEVREISWKPGQVRPPEAVGNRVVRIMQGGTLLRKYPDGKTQEIVFKTGEIKWFDASTVAYSLKNIGKTDVVLFAVILK